MGREITGSGFSPSDFEIFRQRLSLETTLLSEWFRDDCFADTEPEAGLELEAWLIDERGYPAPINEAYLERLDDPLVGPELATFNVEINSTPLALKGDALSRMADELDLTWTRCNAMAGEMNGRLGMMGILPTLRQSDLTLANMSALQRYRALNEQVLLLRRGEPLRLSIHGQESLSLVHEDVMLESAATSFQIHLRLRAAEGVRYYNAAKIFSAPMVALSANSPFLFGHPLWHETRIPLFEQSVSVGASDLTKRVSFGLRYAEQSLMECFDANLNRYPVLLPQLMDEAVERLAHLRLHNGTIWRWNRPLVGFDADGRPHLRLEHRVIPAGPSVADAIANAAVFFGAVRALATAEEAPETRLSFEQARGNFYQAAREGLDAELVWLGGDKGRAADLVLNVVLPLAASGLKSLDIDRREIEHWLGLIEGRVRSGQTGAAWQLRYRDIHDADMQGLVEAYLERQASGRPVHEWAL